MIREIATRLRKIRAVILCGDTTDARWWSRQFERCREECEVLRDENARLLKNAKISSESFSRVFDDWQRAECRAACLDRDIRALQDHTRRSAPKRDARGRFVRY